MIESSLNKLASIKETIQGSENAYGKIVLKHADKDEVATLEVEVREMSEEECPVAIIRKYSPDETGYDGEQREAHIFRFDGNTLFQRMYVPVELLHQKYKYKFGKSKEESEWNDDTSIVTRDDQEDRIQSILKDLSECVIIDGELWEKESCYEPGYWVRQQDDKILLSVDAFLMEESDQEDSFNALQFEEAKKYAEKLAEKTGLPLVMPERMHKERLIEVVMPEAIKMDPQKKAKESILAKKKDIEKYLDVIKGWNQDMSQMEQYQIVHLWYCLREAAAVAEGGAT